MISAHDLVKEYGTFRALDGVSFDLEDGEVLGIVGHNGAGKTTLLKILSGLSLPTAGGLEVGGADVLADPSALKRTLGYLPEESRLYETMKVYDYLAFFGEIYGLDRATIRARGGRLLASLSLDPGEKKIGELSKGMRRKVAIARSLIHDPSFLVYDEPTSGLDPMTGRFIGEFLKGLGEEGKTIVLSAHNLFQVEAVCDRVMILRRGRIEAFGTMAELRERFGSLTYAVFFTVPDPGLLDSDLSFSRAEGVYLAEAADVEGMNAVTAAVTAAGGRVERVESRYPSLEEMLVAVGR
ncbi:ABC transporter ATP-binding protein [Methanofollis aquaemaris]|uniref:ABC transporter ATP-binding protein n=1 Tax=Methanofollis aquaemaris TaxID=126734 RepID=A0A8A3S4G7_9EURY|nr:ABC transporter ATP-binding protein [Methanofollis aquaemaris]QSZ67015.1 ABC transporter ATP-binding protein [Methanofollis aquaemaris]